MIQVSIIVPTKNRPQFLSNILRNFFRQDYPLKNMELIIGDDGDCLMEKLIPIKNNIKYYKFNNITLLLVRSKSYFLSKNGQKKATKSGYFYLMVKKTSLCKLFLYKLVHCAAF